MTIITGDLRLVSDRPAEVTQVHVRARETRAEDGGLTLGKPDSFPVHDGFLDISVRHGPAFLVLVYVGGAVESIPILVDDVEAESLENVVNAAKVATSGNREWLEKLAAEVIVGTQGPKGERGPQGLAGPAPTMSIGTVTHLADTEPATAEIVGSSGAYLLNLGIPEGLRGDHGEAPTLAIGAVTTVDSDQPATASMVLTAENYYTLSLSIPRGYTGNIDLVDEAVEYALTEIAYPAITTARDEAIGEVAGAVAAELDHFESRMVPQVDPSPVNLVDPDTTVFGILETLGTIAPRENRQVTDWIPVTPGDQYVSWSSIPTAGGIEGGHRLLFFDADRVLLPGQDTAYRAGGVAHHWTAPPSAAYVRIGMSPMPEPNPPLDEVLIFNEGTVLYDPDAPVDTSWWEGKVRPPVQVDDLEFTTGGKIPSTLIWQTPEDQAVLAALIDQRAEEKVTALLSYLDKPLAYPDGFAEVPITLTERFTGTITHDVDFDVYRNPAGAIHLYFDSTRTSGDGTQESPFPSWNDLTTAVNVATGDVVVHVMSDFSNRSIALLATEMVIDAKRVSIVSDSPAGESWLTAASEALTWTQDGTVWTTPRSGTCAVFSATTDEYGVPIPLHPAVTLDECRATASSWWTDGTLVAVNSPDRPTTQTHHVVLSVRGASRYFVQNGGQLYMEGISFLAGHVVNIRGDSTGTAIFNRVKFIGGDLRNQEGITGNGLNLTDVKTTMSFDCIAAHNPRDGFNYHYANTPVAQRRSMLAFEYNCLAYSLGQYSTAGNNNATTGHEGISVLRVGTAGRDMTGPALADVGGCLSVNYQCDMTRGTRNYVFEAGEAWLYDCRSTAPATGEHVLLTEGAILHGGPVTTT